MISGGISFPSDRCKPREHRAVPEVHEPAHVPEGSALCASDSEGRVDLESYLVNSVGCLRKREPFIYELVNEPLS